MAAKVTRKPVKPKVGLWFCLVDRKGNIDMFARSFKECEYWRKQMPSNYKNTQIRPHLLIEVPMYELLIGIQDA